jgi:diacylglycerol kinase (ATP)
LEIDGQEVNIEEYENLIVMNIDQWGGGVTDLWKKERNGGNWKDNSYGDGLIEVIGLTDVLHMGQVQVGMDEPFQVGQGRVLTLKSKIENTILPVQIDGEPIDIIAPFQITIQRKDQINILATVPTEQGKIVNFLHRAIAE